MRGTQRKTYIDPTGNWKQTRSPSKVESMKVGVGWGKKEKGREKGERKDWGELGGMGCLRWKKA